MKKLRSRTGRRPLVVGVFRDQPLSEVAAVAQRLDLDVVQLHGRTEGVEWAKFLPGRLVIRVFSVRTDAVVGQGLVRELSRPGYHHIAALDTAAVAGGDGGSGETFDWSFARHVTHADPLPALVGGSATRSMPLMLAGGLTPDNVQQAIKSTTPFAVDTSTGVESHGVKDPQKIKRFILAVKQP